jgi:hypothetical protein
MHDRCATRRWLLLSLIVIFAGSCDLLVNETRKDRLCGLPGNCCYADDTCLPGASCNKSKGICEAVDGGVTDGAKEGGATDGAKEGSPPDRAVTSPDQQPDSAVKVDQKPQADSVVKVDQKAKVDGAVKVDQKQLDS